MRNNDVTRRVIVLSIVIFSFGIIGCASTGPQFTQQEPDSTTALLYIYRKPRFYGSGLKYTIFANDKPITVMPNGGYFPYQTDLEKVEFRAVRGLHVGLLMAAISQMIERNQILLVLDVEPGETYYIRYKIGNTMELVSEDSAKKDLASLRRTEDITNQN